MDPDGVPLPKRVRRKPGDPPAPKQRRAKERPPRPELPASAAGLPRTRAAQLFPHGAPQVGLCGVSGEFSCNRRSAKCEARCMVSGRPFCLLPRS